MITENVLFQGHQAVSLQTAAVTLIAVHDCGPRIAYLGCSGGKNILLWKPSCYTRGDWDLRGGHRVWTTTPLADESENTYRPDNEPCEVRVTDDSSFTLTGAEDPVNRTRRGFSVTCLDDTTFIVDNFVINCGEMLYSGGIWSLTCTLPGREARYAVPVGDDSSWDHFAMVFFRHWGGHGQAPSADDQAQLNGDQLLLRPRGLELKRMIQAHKGIIAMSDPESGLTFAKQVEYDPDGHYPLGCNIALYVGPDNFMVEMESMSGEKTLKPGAELHHQEKWVVRPGFLPLTRAAESEALFT